MTPDASLKEYYIQFVHNAQEDATKYDDALKGFEAKKASIRQNVIPRRETYKSDYGIDLDLYPEWTDDVYNPVEALYNNVIGVYSNAVADKDRTVLRDLLVYCTLLKNIMTTETKLALANRKLGMKMRDFQKYAAMYYNQVHKFVLQGAGYQFDHGIGIYAIVRMTLPDNVVRNPMIDYAATNAKRRELLEKGIKIYDDKEAAWYKARHIPYEAADYRVYKTENHWYRFFVFDSKLSKSVTMDYEHPEYVCDKFRRMSYTAIADICNTEEEIFDLQVDIKYKLNILLYKYPAKYLNYVRNIKQKHKR